MKILLTGANGFLGSYLTDTLPEKGFETIASGKGECRLAKRDHEKFQYISMDFTDPFAVHDVFEKFQPDIVIHAGAMTRVDECELNQSAAYQVNVEGTVNLLLNAKEAGCFFVFLSTDFIFDGARGMYSEDDKPDPVNYYGKTKLAAEEAVMELIDDWSIVRTVLVYGKPLSGGQNILTTIKDKLDKGEEYKLVTDQVRTPTYVNDLANAIAVIASKQLHGIYHVSGKDVLTPYEMGLKLAKNFDLDANKLIPVDASTFTQPALRPPRTGFNIEKARRELGYEPISFDEGLKRTFKN